jgi:hypothetical protein
MDAPITPTDPITATPPRIVFIVPYRDRPHHKHFFTQYMTTHILASYDPSEYQIYYVHQNDTKPFNRGGMKNIGFLELRRLYPDTYHNITFVFNDVDTVPYKAGILDYNTTVGTVKHFYGFEYALGGFFSIKGSDFEKTGGFPNYWGWGLEDNAMNNRVLRVGIQIDRESSFFPIGDPAIIQQQHGVTRQTSQNEFNRHLLKLGGDDDMRSIRNIVTNVVDDTAGTLTIDVSNFETSVSHIQHYDQKNLALVGSNQVSAKIITRRKGRVPMIM